MEKADSGKMRAALFLGSAGAGKSTLINTLLGSNDAKVSHLILEDGTAKMDCYRHPSIANLVLIDTPGLDSLNFKSHVTEKFQREHLTKDVLIVVVISADTPRVTSFMSKVLEILDDLVGCDKKFWIVWTRSSSGAPSVENWEAMKKKYAKAEMLKDSDMTIVRATFSEASLFVPIKAAIKASVAVSSAKLPGVGKAAAPAKIAAPAQVHHPIGPPQILTTTAGFSYRLNDKGSFDGVLQKVLQAKKTGGEEFQHLKLMGDALLKTVVYRCLYWSGERAELNEKAHLVIDNGVDCAMPRFFDKSVAAEHDKVFPNEKAGEKDAINSHGKADVVEALLEFSSRTKSHAYAFKFILVSLFQEVGLGHVVDCKA